MKKRVEELVGMRELRMEAGGAEKKDSEGLHDAKRCNGLGSSHGRSTGIGQRAG